MKYTIITSLGFLLTCTALMRHSHINIMVLCKIVAEGKFEQNKSVIEFNPKIVSFRKEYGKV